MRLILCLSRFKGDVVGALAGTLRQLYPHRRVLQVTAVLAGCVFVLALGVWSRERQFAAAPQAYFYLDIAGCFLCFFYAVNGLVRFHSTHDRLSLILGFGFFVSGVIETIACFRFYDLLVRGPAGLQHVPLGWMVGRTLLGILLITAVIVERRIPNAREPSREIAAALVVVAVAAYLTSIAYLAAPAAPVVHSDWLIPRPWDLFPAAIFAVAAVFFWNRLRIYTTGLDYVFFWAAVLNVACHVAASLSGRLLDAPFTAAQVLKVSSYALMLGGALLDNARMFEQVRRLAVTDALTGLANYRRLLDVISSEMDRSRRTHRPFAIALFDMDGLKQINDHHGHLVGSRAICRLAQVLRVHCRTTDTAARYGGDEFALVLPEASPEMADRVIRRICARLANDGELPAVSVSSGAAFYPQDGDSTEKLLGAADRALYQMKNRGSGPAKLSRIAACL